MQQLYYDNIYIPAGYIPEVRPNFPTEAGKLADERDALRVTNPADPCIKTISSNIKNMVRDHISTKWRTYLEKCEFSSSANKLWRTTGNLHHILQQSAKTRGSYVDIFKNCHILA